MHRKTKISVERDECKKLSSYHTPEFKKLQMKWYKKLDRSGFEDIERTGKLRQSILDEYGGILSLPLSLLKRNIDSIASARLYNVGKFSETPKTVKILQPILIKVPKNAHLSDFPDKFNFRTDFIDSIDYNSSKDHNNFLIMQTKTIWLSRIDRCILRKYADGYTLEKISNHLRAYYVPRMDFSNKVGRPGTPLGLHFVQYRLKKLLKLMKFWLNYENYYENQLD